MIKTKNLSNILFYLYFFLFLISNLKPMQLYLNYSLVIDFFIFFLLFIFNFQTIKNDFGFLIIATLIVLLSVISVFYSNGGIGSLLNLFHFFFGIMIFKNMSLDKKMISFLYFLCLVLWIDNVLLSFNVWNEYLLGKNLVNPNSVAVFIFLTTVVLKLYLSSKKMKYLTIFLYFVSFYCIYLTNCRSAFVAFVVYIFVSYIPFLNRFIINHNKLINNIIIAVGILFPIIYVNMYLDGFALKLPLFEKNLYTGREVLWYHMFTSLDGNKYGYLFGLGTNYVTNVGIINNFHNWYIGVLYTFGVPIFILYFSFLVKIVSKVEKKEVLYAIMAIFFIGYSETVGLWSTTQTYIFILIILSNIYKKEVDNYDNSIYSNI